MDAAAKTHQKEQQQRADVLAIAHIGESGKLDYFVLSVSLAICGYLVQTNTYATLGLNRETFQLIPIALIGGSAAFGFCALRHKLREMKKKVSAIQQSDTDESVAINNESNYWSRKYRDKTGCSIWLLGAGIFTYATVRVWASYYCQGCMHNLPG